jgi:integrase
LPGRSAQTIRKNKDVLEPILAVIGTVKLRELDAAAVDKALNTMARDYSTAAVRMGHLALKRAIRFAAARDLIGRNVAELSDTPAGQAGRPSRSFTLDQAAALLKTSAGTRIGAYIALSLGTGIRTEEARALSWDAVDLGDPDATPPRPASVGGMAISAPQRGHQDPQIAPDAPPAAIRLGRPTRPAGARGP